VEPIEGGVNDTVIYPSDFKEKTTPSFVNELNEISGREGIEHVKIEPPFLIRNQLTEIYSELYKK
jgi:hypothetical protein